MSDRMNLYLRFLLLVLKSRKREQISMWATSRTPFRVLPNDLDLLGHMNNGRYLTLLDLGRMDLMLRSGAWKKITGQGWYPVVAGQTIAYRKSLNPFVKYDLHTKLLGLDDHGVYIEQSFCVGQDVYAQAVVRARFLKKSGGKVTNEELVSVVGPVPEGRDVPDWVSEWAAQNRSVQKTL